MNKEVLFITGGAYIYGAEIMALKVIGGLAKKGYKLFSVVNGWNDGAFIKELDKVNVPHKAIYLGWLYFSKPLWTLDTLVHLPKAYFQYNRILKRSTAKYVYHYTYQSIFILLPVLKNNNIYHVHDTINTNKARFVLKYIDKKVLYYVACSNVVFQELINYGIKKEKIKLIYNGIDFQQTKQISNVVKNETEPFKIGIVGQIVERKGHHILLKAISIVAKTVGNFKLHIFGSGNKNYIDKLHEIIRVEELENFVVWEGYETNKEKIYSSLDFCVVPTLLTEVFGLVAVEPAVYAKPVIASKCGGLLEIIEDGVTGLLFDQGNENELAQKILHLFSNPHLINSMGERAYNTYKEKFSDTKMISQFDDLLNQ